MPTCSLDLGVQKYKGVRKYVIKLPSHLQVYLATFLYLPHAVFLLSSVRTLTISRVCAVAQYAVLEARMLKSMGDAHFRTPTPSKPLNQFRCHVKYITTSPQGVDVQNLVGIDSAVTDLRMREKTRFVWIFFINISVCVSIRPFLRRGYRSQFWADFYA